MFLAIPFVVNTLAGEELRAVGEVDRGCATSRCLRPVEPEDVVLAASGFLGVPVDIFAF